MSIIFSGTFVTITDDEFSEMMVLPVEVGPFQLVWFCLVLLFGHW